MVDQKTAHLKLPLPHTDNSLDQDCSRIRQSLTALDSHAQSADAALAAHDERLNNAAANLAGESQAREQGDAAQSAALAALRQELAALAETVANIRVDPWDVFPMRVPIAVDGVTFPEGENARHPIMPGETEPRENWLICDGGSDGKGGTVPDLRGRMILGASDTHQAGDTGGSEEHTHSLSGTVGATTLSVAQLASHQHGGVRQHTMSPQPLQYGGSSYGYLADTSTQWTGGSQSHEHSFSGISGQANGLPPYYSLAYIMRCA